MQKLVEGIHKFQQNYFPSQQVLFERLAHQQEPLALFITCSDSRINPNLLTNTDPGELFILRNAGALIPPFGVAGSGEAATIEFAVAGLGVQDIIICGHSNCGACKALLDPSLCRDMPAMNTWLNNAQSTRLIMAEKYPHLDGEALLNAAVQENVLVQLENLRTHPVVAAGLAKGKLNLHGWVYKIQTGQVFTYRPESGQFLATTEAPPTPATNGKPLPARAI